ncbi:hypothetical protein PR048_031176 [Dryococelus australis]|uniref:PiggyBac transposable element-derived protein domain-containing protein n=1 Tax=Dryococelus australis TaxID=614101 RepID=A0ABQ9G4I3_9NEOP|nr:hypothetical protein PR048_031176 [Dryococelus australis]
MQGAVLQHLMKLQILSLEKIIKWQKGPFTAERSPSTPDEQFEEIHGDIEMKILKKMSTMTNIYALQKGDMNSKPTSQNEIQTFFVLHIAMGSLRFQRARLYWDTALCVKFLYEFMTRNRFIVIGSNLHVVNILERPENRKDLWIGHFKGT